MAASAGLRFPVCNFVKKETPAKMFFCEFLRTKFLRTSFDRTPPLTTPCVYMTVLRSFSEHLFYRPPDRVRNYFTSVFQAFYTRATSSNSKTLKS